MQGQHAYAYGIGIILGYKQQDKVMIRIGF